MPDNTMYGPGAQLLEGAGRTNSQTAGQGVERRGQNVQAATAAGAQQGEDRRQKDAEQAKDGIEKLKQEMGYVKLTAPIAMGLAKHTRNKEWLKAIGTEMPADQLLGIYTAETQAAAKERAPKVVSLQEGDQSYHAITWIDDDGVAQTARLDKGGEKFNPNSGKSSKGKPNIDQEKTWLSEYDKIQKRYEGIKGEIAKGSNDPDSKLQYQKDEAFLADNRAKHDRIMKNLSADPGSSGGSGTAAAGAKPSPDDKFDPNKFIDEAIGNAGL